MASAKVPRALQPSSRSVAGDPLLRSLDRGTRRPDVSPLSQGAGEPPASRWSPGDLGKPAGLQTLRPSSSKLSSRTEAHVLSETLDTMLLEAQGDLRREMLAFDWVNSELVQQVHSHCAERGALLERCRVQHHEWVVRLMLAVQELKISREKAFRSEREAVAKQEARLSEQLGVTRTLQQQISRTAREADLQRKAAFARSMGKGGPDVERFNGSEAWKNVRHMMAFITGARDAAAQRTSAERAAKIRSRVDKLCQVICDDLQPEHLHRLMRRIMYKIDPDYQLEIVQTVLEALQPSVQASIVADLFESFSASQMSTLLSSMGEDSEVADAVERFKDALQNEGVLSTAQDRSSPLHQFECATHQARKDYLQELNGLLTDEERGLLLAGSFPDATEAPIDTDPESAEDAAWLKQARRSPKRKIILRRASAANSALQEEATRGGAGIPVCPQKPVGPAVLVVPEAQEVIVHQESPQRMPRGALATQLQKKSPANPRRLTTAELLRLIAAAVCHRYKAEGRTSLPEFEETVWEYICVAEDVRSAALQQLHNLSFSLASEAAASNEDATASPVRITAFRALTGLHPPGGSAWPASQSAFYLFAMHELLTANSRDASLTQLQRTLSQALVYIELPQAVSSLRNVVSDAGLLSDLTGRVMEMAAGEVVAGRHPTPAVSLDWILDQLVAAWTGANAKAEKELQELFVRADDNGDGALRVPRERCLVRHTQCTDNHATCCRCAVALRVSNDSTDAAWRNAGTPRPLVCAALYRRTAAAHSCPPLLVCQSSMDQDFEIYNECIEQSGEPDIETATRLVCSLPYLTLACLSTGGGDLILPEVFTRVCMAKQLIPGQGAQYVRKVSILI